MTNVLKVIIRSGNFLDGIQLMMSDGVKMTYSPAFGGFGGTSVDWYVPSNEFITQIETWVGNPQLFGIQLSTNKGSKSPFCGQTVGTYSLMNVPSGYRIIGLYGNANNLINRLGIFLGKNIYPDRPATRY